MDIKKLIGIFTLSWNKVVSWYAIDLRSGKIASKNDNLHIYPASSYKIFVAAEILKKIESGELKLDEKIYLENKFPAWADVFPINSKTIGGGQKITIDGLLKLMLQESDNRASNQLISLLAPDFVKKNGGTQAYEDSINLCKRAMYSEKIEINAHDLAEFMAKIFNGNSFVNLKLREYMLHDSKPGQFKNTVLQKSGFLEAMSKTGPKFLRKLVCVRYKSQAAVIKSDKLYYAVGILTKCNSLQGSKQIDLVKFQKEIERIFLAIN